MRFVGRSSLPLVFLVAMTCVAASEPIGVMSSGGRYYIEFSPSPAAIDIMHRFDIEVRIRAGGPRGEMLCDAALKPDLLMQGHGHGMTVVPNVIRRENCAFLVQGMMMHMPGLWTLILGVERGRNAERAYFHVDIWDGD